MNHKYSTVFVLLIFLLVVGSTVLAELTSEEIDYVCDQDNHTLFRYNGQWGCANLLDSNIFNYTVNNITNIFNNYSLYSNQSSYGVNDFVTLGYTYLGNEGYFQLIDNYTDFDYPFPSPLFNCYDSNDNLIKCIFSSGIHMGNDLNMGGNTILNLGSLSIEDGDLELTSSPTGGTTGNITYKRSAADCNANFGIKVIDGICGDTSPFNIWEKTTIHDNLNVTDNITSVYFKGNGSLLTGIESGIWTDDNGVALYEGNVNISSGNLSVDGGLKSGVFENNSWVNNKGIGSTLLGYQRYETLFPGFTYQYGMNSLGNGSLAGGYAGGTALNDPDYINATGNGAFVWGITSSGSLVGSGDSSFTVGVGDQYNYHAGGVNLGGQNDLNGTGKTAGIALGVGNSVWESYGVAIGFGNHVYPGGLFASVAIGSSNTVNGTYTYAVGRNNNAYHTGSGIFGYDIDSSDTYEWTVGNKARFLRFPSEETPYFNGSLNVTGNLTVEGNIIVGGCVVYNGGTLGTCV